MILVALDDDCVTWRGPKKGFIADLRGALVVCGTRWFAVRAGLRDALGQARLTGGACFVRVPRRPAASSSLTSQNKLPRLAVPGTACRQTTFAGKESAVYLKGFAIVGPSRPRRCPRPTMTLVAGPDANRESSCQRDLS